MSKPAPLRLIAFHDSINDAVALASQLRNAGVQAQARHAEDLPQLHELLREENADLVLHLLELPEPTLAEVVQSLSTRQPALPVLGMTEDYNIERLGQAIRDGAVDLIALEHPPHLLHVIRREMEALNSRRRLVQLESMHQESERRCHALMESSRDAIAYVHGGMHIYANAVYLEKLGFKRLEDMEGTPLLDQVDHRDHSRLRELMREQPDGEGQSNTLDEVEFKRQDGSSFKASVEISPATIEGEPCTQVLIRTRDDTKALEEQINFLSQRDLLTGLYNRQYFLQQLEAGLNAAREEEHQAALIHLQITNTKDIKHKLGVAGMDVLITEAGKLIEKVVGPETLLSRYGAHAFAVLIADHDSQNAASFARKIISCLTQHIFEVGGQSTTVKVAAGIALLDQDTPSVNELLNRAERATMDAEAHPSDDVALYKPKEGEVSQGEQDEQWNRLLRDALRANRFRLLFQPLLSLQGETGRQRYETFLRLLDEQGQPISPSVFIAAAERTEISRAIDRWVILNALQQIAEARQRQLRVQLFVRLSSRTVADPEFPGWLSERLMAMQIHDGSLAVEISESVAADHLKQTKDLQRHLTSINCPILIDGFGLGDDPFRVLNYLDVQWLKLDRSLMESFASQKANQEKVRELIRTNKERSGNQLIVANVEDATTLQLVLGDGADFVQGNFIQPPVERLDFDFNAF
ncbi:MAG: EAL domain-containing protein [Pseudomonadota bacterium]